jgi:hypothetical protein
VQRHAVLIGGYHVALSGNVGKAIALAPLSSRSVVEHGTQQVTLRVDGIIQKRSYALKRAYTVQQRTKKSEHKRHSQ